MIELDLSTPSTPRLRYTSPSFIEAHTLTSNLGLTVERWNIETGEEHEGRALYTASFAPLAPAQEKVLAAAQSSARLTQQREPSEEDRPGLEDSWVTLNASLFPDHTEELPPHLDALYLAVFLPPPGVTPPRPAKAAPKAAPTRAAPPPKAAAAPAPAPATPAAPPPAAAPAAPAAAGPAAKPAAAPETPAAKGAKKAPAKKAPEPAKAPIPLPPIPTPGAAPGAMDVAKLKAMIQAAFPADGSPPEGASCRLTAEDVVAPKEAGDAVKVVLRLFCYDENKTISDIKEQECFLGTLSKLQDAERVGAFVEGWRLATEELFRKVGQDERRRSWMPFNLFHPDVLGLQTARTAQDFQKALLMRSRLGKLLG